MPPDMHSGHENEIQDQDSSLHHANDCAGLSISATISCLWYHEKLYKYNHNHQTKTLDESATLQEKMPFPQLKGAAFVSTTLDPDIDTITEDSTDCCEGDTRRSSITCCLLFFPSMLCSLPRIISR